MKNKITAAAIFVAGLAAGVGGNALIGLSDVAAQPASIHTFCVRSDPQYGENDPSYDADAGVRYVVEAYGNLALEDGGVLDVGSAPKFEVPGELIAPIRAEITARWKSGRAGVNPSP